MSEQEDTRQNFIKAAERSFEHYKETGSHISLDDFSALGAQTVVFGPESLRAPGPSEVVCPYEPPCSLP